MNPALLELYERELRHVREMGAEFAAEFPKIAGRLSLDGIECADPYVERLLEGFAFCAARVQHKLDASFPRFTEALLNSLYPQYLCPTPSMAVVELSPDFAESSLLEGYTVPRGSVLRGLLAAGDKTACEFRTAHDCELWPLQVSEAKYLPNQGAVAAAGLGDDRGVRGAIRLTLECPATTSFADLALDRLTVYLSGDDELPYRLYEQVHGDAVGFVLREGGAAKGSALLRRGIDAISRPGFSPDQSLLPNCPRSFDGYRLLNEYFAFPARYLFAEFSGLKPAVSRTRGQKLELAILLDRVDKELVDIVRAENFRLHCTPAINLFPRRADRIHLNNRDHEFHVVVDRTRPLDFEVHTVRAVSGIAEAGEPPTRFTPLYAPREVRSGRSRRAYYATRREPRMLSSKSKRLGPRSSYVGSEIFLSLVDLEEAPFPHQLKQLELELLCTNRDLPIEMPVGQGDTDFTLEGGAPVESARCISGPTRPRASPARSELNWRAISQLSLNYVSLVCEDEASGTSGLRDLLAVCADLTDASTHRQIDGIGRVSARPVYRRLPVPGPIVFGRGTEIGVHFFDEAFEGGGIFLFGAVLERFFARYASINSFTEVAISTETRGKIRTWPSMPGQRHVL